SAFKDVTSDRTMATVDDGLVTSLNADVPARLYSSGLMNPSECPAAWLASAMMPATSGEARLVPPMRYSLYFAEPSGNVWVSPIRYPVLGSATAEMSGTARPVR